VEINPNTIIDIHHETMTASNIFTILDLHVFEDVNKLEKSDNAKTSAYMFAAYNILTTAGRCNTESSM